MWTAFRILYRLLRTLVLSGASGGHALPICLKHRLCLKVGRGLRTRRHRTQAIFPTMFSICVLVSLFRIFPNARAESPADPLLVFAAASLADAMTEVGQAFEVVESTEIVFNFASSSILARQIKSGAPADVFMSADEAKMDDLERGGWLVADTRHSLLGNQLVIVVPVDSQLKLSDERDLVPASVTRIALADPRSVPAGIYTRTFLQDQRLWDTLVPKVIPTANVRAALAAVESGNVEAGFVYLTDAIRSTRASILYRVPIDEGPVISYPVAVVRKDRLNPLATRFVSFLSQPEPMRIFISHGFIESVRKVSVGEKPGSEAP